LASATFLNRSTRNTMSLCLVQLRAPNAAARDQHPILKEPVYFENYGVSGGGVTRTWSSRARAVRCSSSSRACENSSTTGRITCKWCERKADE